MRERQRDQHRLQFLGISPIDRRRDLLAALLLDFGRADRAGPRRAAVNQPRIMGAALFLMHLNVSMTEPITARCPMHRMPVSQVSPPTLMQEQASTFRQQLKTLETQLPPAFRRLFTARFGGFQRGGEEDFANVPRARPSASPAAPLVKVLGTRKNCPGSPLKGSGLRSLARRSEGVGLADICICKTLQGLAELEV